MLKNPICLRMDIGREEAEELMDYLYYENITYISYYPNKENVEKVAWFSGDNHIGNWTKEYKKLMVSKNILLNRT